MQTAVSLAASLDLHLCPYQTRHAYTGKEWTSIVWTTAAVKSKDEELHVNL